MGGHRPVPLLGLRSLDGHQRHAQGMLQEEFVMHVLASVRSEDGESLVRCAMASGGRALPCPLTRSLPVVHRRRSEPLGIVLGECLAGRQYREISLQRLRNPPMHLLAVARQRLVRRSGSVHARCTWPAGQGRAAPPVRPQPAAPALPATSPKTRRQRLHQAQSERVDDCNGCGSVSVAKRPGAPSASCRVAGIASGAGPSDVAVPASEWD